MNLELKLPPVFQFFLIGGAMGAIARADLDYDFELAVFVAAREVLATVFLIMGMVIALLGVLAFRRASTTVDPRNPQQTSALVTSGIYQRSRNPMYMGMLMVLVAWGVYLASGLSLLGPIIFVAYITRFQILPEERWMVRNFGEPYSHYQRRVRRWI